MINNSDISSLLQPIQTFLKCDTPEEWLIEAQKPKNLAVILTDHLLCELKAGQSAMLLIKKYAADKNSAADLHQWLQPYEAFAYRNTGNLKTLKDQNNFSKNIIVKSDSPYSQKLIDKMVLLIKEELHHFYQVLEIMEHKGIQYQSIPASRYAKGMFSHVKTYEPDTLVDKLIIGAYIEARSCERFARLAPYMDSDISGFYVSLLRSEARHFLDYLNLAQSISSKDISPRIQEFGRIEAELISSPDIDFKFHSGVPV